MSLVFTILGMLGLIVQAESSDTQALQRMVASERAFAAATAEIGVRDGFLTFFSDDSVQLVPGASGASTTVIPARAGLMAQPKAPLPLGSTLMWEPYTGHVSNDGTLGWLTGGYVLLSVAEPRTIVAQGAYFSVWKHQADGTWRVWLDEGVNLPTVWRDASPFRVAPEPDTGDAGDAGETLEGAESAIQDGGESWADRLADGVRVHRDGVMPLVGRAVVRDWAGPVWRSVRFALATTVVAESGDLGIAVGGYDATTPSGAEHGTWVRVWKRDVTGRWRIVFETSKAAS